MEKFRKIVNIGKVLCGNRHYNNFVEILFDENSVLHISGVTGPTHGGGCHGSAGQCLTDVSRIEKFSKGWTPEMRDKLLKIWLKWHLNDMRAGTPKQMKALEECQYTDYSKQCEFLESRGLKYDDGYLYGSSWLFEEVPEEVLIWLKNLPKSAITPAWI